MAAGFNLQLAVVAVGPLLADIRADTGMTSAVAGLLQTVPFLCIGAVALAAPAVAAGTGPESLAARALALICLAAAARALMPSPALLVAASVPLGLGIGTLTLALPAVVKIHFPRAAGAVIGGYVAALSTGAAGGALLAVPISHAFGSWRPALAACALPAAVALPVWLRATRGLRGRAAGAVASAPAARGRRPPPLALRLAALFAGQSLVFTGMISWVATLYRDHGWSSGRAALATATISLVTIPASLLVPGRSDGGDRRPWIMGTALALTAGTLGIALAPTAAPWLWLVIFGAGTGAIFPLVLALPLDIAGDQRAAATLSAWMIGLGYAVSAASPTAVGGLRDLSGGFTLPMAILAGVALAVAVAANAPGLRPVAEPLA
jgi:MFS transporter, CP family, cyanate transporter